MERNYTVRAWLADGGSISLSVRAKYAATAVKRGRKAARLMGYRVVSAMWTAVSA